MPLSFLFSFVFAAFPQLVQSTLTDTPKETLIRLNVQPMAAPKPALRYLLLPELKEMTPGNPIPNYLKCLMDQDFSVRLEKETLGKAALRQADRAARMDKPDWQILLQAKTEGFSLLLPDVQKMRVIAANLQDRFRTELAQRRFDDAIVTAKTMFALSRHVGEHPTLIGDLVGIAIAHIAIGPLEEMLAQPGCPNLYWALTNLPNPLVSLEKGLEGERLLTQAELRDLDDVTPMTPAQLKKLIAHIDKLLEFDRGPKDKTQAWLNARVNDGVLVVAARKRLVEYGIPEERLLTFPPEQILLLDEKHEFEVRRDDVAKLMSLPTWYADEQLAQLQLATKITLALQKNRMLFGGFVPALHKVRQAQGRLEQRIAFLRHVEALRMYAAEHDGKLPEKLTDVAVPLPVDPFTGKPFRYVLEGGTAHLRGNPPRGGETVQAYNLHYEITIQK